MKTESKMSKARVLFAEIHARGYNLNGKTQRAVFIERAIEEQGLSKHCASTYYQNISNHVNKGMGLYHYNKPTKKVSKKDVKQAEAQVLLMLPLLDKQRWMAVDENGVEVNNFATRAKAQDFAKVNGYKCVDRNKAA